MTTDRLDELLLSTIERWVPPGATCLVAVSGGADSLALLDIAAATSTVHRRALVVAHVDHGIADGSAAVASSVERAAAHYRLPFVSQTLSLGAEATETEARRARRAALRALARAHGASVVMLAHHADDQAETVLMRLLRGSGPAGLAAMRARRGIWFRPLLSVRRAELAERARYAGMPVWHDPANADPRHTRSWLRREVVPLLQHRFPDVVERLAGSAQQAAEARAGANALPDALVELQLDQSERGISVAALPLQGYRSALRHAVLAAIGRRMGVLLGRRRLRALDQLLAEGHSGARIMLGGRLQAELSMGRLTFIDVRVESMISAQLSPEGPVRCGGVEARTSIGTASVLARRGWHTAFVPGRFTLRRWQPGDRIRPLAGTGSRSVSVLLREAGVTRTERERWPVLIAEDDATIVWVPGICRSDARIPSEGSEAWNVDCDFH